VVLLISASAHVLLLPSNQMRWKSTSKQVSWINTDPGSAGKTNSQPSSLYWGSLCKLRGLRGMLREEVQSPPCV